MSIHSNITNTFGDYEQYLHYIAELDLSPKEKLELLHIVNSILSYFVDQAFGVSTDQITLESASNTSRNPLGHAMFSANPENQTARVEPVGAESDSTWKGPTEP